MSTGACSSESSLVGEVTFLERGGSLGPSGCRRAKSDLWAGSLGYLEGDEGRLQGCPHLFPIHSICGSCCNVSYGLCFPGVCAVNGLLYVVGGDDGSCNLASVEYYNPVTDKWTLLPTNMSTGRSYAGQCAAPQPHLHPRPTPAQLEVSLPNVGPSASSRDGG